MSQISPEQELPAEKQKFISKFRLVPKEITGKLYWVREFSNRPDHPYATHRALRNCHIIELVFSIYDLCVAKMTYFKRHQHRYHPCKRDVRSGEFVPCPLWDMEFLVQKKSGIAIDLRNLAAIHDINEFRAFCVWLEEEYQLSSAEAAPRQPLSCRLCGSLNWSAATWSSPLASPYRLNTTPPSVHSASGPG